ncbi:NADH-quinone oxidoreductase subunit L [Aquisphaera giovannonii]|uniref:NADH-quinone oxidoreductase subunit L n=1 Tax=Aquisphaera giovannonii TaxID=406548 RepID=A0A5B9VY32_9BACT|nr:NADH-quinone oxidoreductase subunit L [Aquisphaera giovannonii]QEH32897.1 NADH-quinone oxidoreductase subunit L [Aquisphaera giovannonii]
MNWQVGLYVAAVLIPLAAFAIEVLFIRQLKRLNAYVATGAIALSFVLSLAGFIEYYLVEASGVFAEHHAATAEAAGEEHADAGGHEAAGEAVHGPHAWAASYDWVVLDGVGKGAEGSRPAALSFPLGVRIDNLSAIMFLMVTFIATLIHVYSMGYMHDDARYPRFFAYLSLFCFSMLGLVASANVFMIFIFWELVGVCSYLLIGFWYEEKANCDAANKAFIVNRVGDVGMLIGLGILWTQLGTFNINDLNTGLRAPDGSFHQSASSGEGVVEYRPAAADGEPAAPVRIPTWLLTVAGLGIFAGCCGKSAQFPLHVWLPDAMAGPTPVSALIHAATMVAAGVYLVGRFFPLFTPDALLVIAYTGGITLFIAATIAVVQTDYKKVLAYSTVSQLGFMMLALGVGGRAAGLFHLITHAFFKALLFLGAGSVYHSVHTYDMPALGGLSRKMPITAGTMLVGTLAICGVPFFSGFYSKDAILAAALARVALSPGHFLLFVLPALGATITAFYMFRMWLLTFAGEPRGFAAPAEARAVHDTLDEEHELAREDEAHGHGAGHDDLNPVAHAHESGPIMTRPLIALAACSIFVGWTVWLGLPIGTPVLEQMLAYGEPAGVINGHWAHGLALLSSLAIAATGIGLGFLYYAPPGLPYFVPLRLSPAAAARRFHGLYTLFRNKWYFDEIYRVALVQPCLGLARFCGRLDRFLIDGVVNGLAALTAQLSRFDGFFDRVGVDGLVNLVGQVTYLLGDRGRMLQTGKLRNYLMFLAAALVGLFATVFAWVST